MKSPRQLLAERGLRPNKRLGQNFLLEDSLVEKIISSSGLSPDQPLLEVGPGLGALTGAFLEKGFQITAVELDSRLAEILKDEIQPLAPHRLTILEEDILKTDIRSLAEKAGQPLALVGNLPYQISSPLFFKMLDNREHLTKAVFMVQREVADRLMAYEDGKIGTKVYGRLGVIFGYFCELNRLVNVGTDVFYPRPKVGSTVVELRFRSSPAPSLKSEKVFLDLVRAGFGNRRKTLRNALKTGFSPERILDALKRSGIESGRRAETLTPEEFAVLSNLLFESGEAKNE